MKKIKKISFATVTLALTLGFSSLTAFSQETAPASQEVGASNSARFDKGWYGVLSANSNTKITPTLDAGYQFNKVLSLEGTYGFLSTDVQESIPTIALRAVGSYRINDDFTLQGRAGVASLKRTSKCIAAFNNTCYSKFNDSVFEKDYVNHTFGAGFQYEAFEDFAIRVSYDAYRFGEDSKAVYEFGLGVVKRF